MAVVVLWLEIVAVSCDFSACGLCFAANGCGCCPGYCFSSGHDCLLVMILAATVSVACEGSLVACSA